LRPHCAMEAVPAVPHTGSQAEGLRPVRDVPKPIGKVRVHLSGGSFGVTRIDGGDECHVRLPSRVARSAATSYMFRLHCRPRLSRSRPASWSPDMMREIRRASIAAIGLLFPSAGAARTPY